MTRRKLLRKLFEMVVAITAGAWWLVRKASPRRFIRAVKLDKFPGSLKSLQNIENRGKWSG